MPPALMDLLLSANIAVAVIMLLTSVYVRRPLEFSIFPSLLLATTLGRLVLNVATTRLILTRAEGHGLDAAGGVVRTFGEFVAGDRAVVGLVIFSIVVVIQFVVITKGATRISEVAARFALDGMPGRQMAIDADLSAGLIDQKEAQARRADINRQADFFGAMDGASKFVRGDAIAGVVIILVNIVGGLFIGVVQSGMNVRAATEIFTKLTIGDGLVTQVPAFLISLAAGLLVTRSSEETDLPSQFVAQVFSRPQALVVTAAFLGLLSLTHLPRVPLVLIGAGSVAAALALSRRERAASAEQHAAASKPAEPRVEQSLAIDPMEIEIGIGLIRLADPKRGGDLLARVQRVRKNVAAELGILMPKVRIRDNTRLDANAYRIRVADLPVADGHLHPGMLLALDSDLLPEKLEGVPVLSSAFGRPGLWIQPAMRPQAQSHGCVVIEPVEVLATHLTEVVRKHADELLTRDATRHLLDELKTRSPAVVDELVPGVMKLADVQQVLHLLLREGVPIRHLELILESLGDHSLHTRDPIELAERVRQRLARILSTRFRDPDNRLLVLTLDPAIEEQIVAGFERTERGLSIRMPPATIEGICRLIEEEFERFVRERRSPVVLVSPRIRAALKQLTATRLPQLVVLSYAEITPDTHVESVAMIRDAVLAAA
jgi:flagellar biosynthesis protein FlhA